MDGIGTEVTFTLPADQVAAGLTAFGLRDGDAERRRIHFLDAPDPDGTPRLLGRHVIIRVRRRADDSGDVTVTLRPAVRDRLTGRWRPGTGHEADYRVRIDWAAEKTLAASVEATVGSGVAELLDGPPKRLLTAEQQHFLRRCGPELDMPLRGVGPRGPVHALQWRDLTAGELTGLRAERWTWAGDRTCLALSLRCADHAEAARRRSLLAAEIERHGLKPDDAATTRTETVIRDLL